MSLVHLEYLNKLKWLNDELLNSGIKQFQSNLWTKSNTGSEPAQIFCVFACVHVLRLFQCYFLIRLYAHLCSVQSPGQSSPGLPWCPFNLVSSSLFFFRSEDKSTNGIEAPSPSSSTRWATAPWWVIVIWTVGLEWARGWRGL